MLLVHICHFLCLVSHIAYGISWIDDSYSRTIAHEDGVEFEVDDHGDLEDAAAVLILPDQFLAMMERLGLDILALFHGSPELDGAWSVVDILAHSYDIIKELFAIELGIFPEGFIDGLNGYNSVKGKVVQDQVFFH